MTFVCNVYDDVFPFRLLLVVFISGSGVLNVAPDVFQRVELKGNNIDLALQQTTGKGYFVETVNTL